MRGGLAVASGCGDGADVSPEKCFHENVFFFGKTARQNEIVADGGDGAISGSERGARQRRRVRQRPARFCAVACARDLNQSSRGSQKIIGVGDVHKMSFEDAGRQGAACVPAWQAAEHPPHVVNTEAGRAFRARATRRLGCCRRDGNASGTRTRRDAAVRTAAVAVAARAVDTRRGRGKRTWLTLEKQGAVQVLALQGALPQMLSRSSSCRRVRRSLFRKRLRLQLPLSGGVIAASSLRFVCQR